MEVAKSDRPAMHTRKMWLVALFPLWGSVGSLRVLWGPSGSCRVLWGSAWFLRVLWGPSGPPWFGVSLPGALTANRPQLSRPRPR